MMHLVIPKPLRVNVAGTRKVRPIIGHESPGGGVEVQIYSFFNLEDGGEGSTQRTVRFSPGKETQSRLGGLQGQSRRTRKISPPPAFDPRAVQPVASRYTDYA